MLEFSDLIERTTFWGQTALMVGFVCWAVNKPQYQFARIVGGHTPFLDFLSVALAGGGAAMTVAFNIGLTFAPEWVSSNFGITGVIGLRAFDIGAILYVVLPAWRKRWSSDSGFAIDSSGRIARANRPRDKAHQ